MLSLLSGCAVHTKAVPTKGAAFVPSHNHAVCMLPGLLPAGFQYFEVGRIAATKRTYGGSDQLIGEMANEARKLGADAVVNFHVGQKFKSPLPWRVVAPTGSGTAVKLKPESPAIDCAMMGGRSV